MTEATPPSEGVETDADDGDSWVRPVEEDDGEERMRLRGAVVTRSDELLDAFKDMTLIELSEFVRRFEETFGVRAVSPVAAAAAQPAAIGAFDEASEQAEFDVVLGVAGTKKIQVIKEVRTLTGLGLKEAKDLVDRGGVILEKVDRDTAVRASEVLGGLGATVSVR